MTVDDFKTWVKSLAETNQGIVRLTDENDNVHEITPGEFYDTYLSQEAEKKHGNS